MKTKTAIIMCLFFFLVLALKEISLALPEYSEQTGKGCGVCHVNPDGGGDLTAQGLYFQANKVLPPEQGEESGDVQKSEVKFKPILPLSHNLRLLVGFLHVVISVIWFGAIFYVHLIIGPGKLRAGIPKAERKLGVGSILGVFITGSILTLTRIDSFSVLATTFFGKVLLLKILFFFCMVFFAIIAITVLHRAMSNAGKNNVSSEKGIFTSATLSAFNGQNGKPTYVAIDGKVYDLSTSRRWKEGIHLRRHHAGKDLSDELQDAPHGKEVFEKFPIVGTVVETPSEEKNKPPKAFAIFKALTYINLLLALLILLCISFWRWGFPIISH